MKCVHKTVGKSLNDPLEVGCEACLKRTVLLTLRRLFSSFVLATVVQILPLMMWFVKLKNAHTPVVKLL